MKCSVFKPKWYMYPGLKPIASDLEIILNAVCRASGIIKEDICSQKRKREIVAARQVFCYYARELTEHSYQKIGETVRKDYDHASVLYSVAIVDKMLSIKDKMIEDLVNKVSKLL